MLWEHATEARLRIWNRPAIIAVLLIAGCREVVTPRAAVKPDTLGRIVWKLKEQDIVSGSEFSLQPGQTVKISCVLEPPKSWRFSTLGTIGFGKGAGGTPEFPAELEKAIQYSPHHPTSDTTPSRVGRTTLYLVNDKKPTSLNLEDSTFMSALVERDGQHCHLRANLKIPDTPGTYWLVLYWGSVAEEAYNEFQPTDYGFVPVAEVRITVQ